MIQYDIQSIYKKTFGFVNPIIPTKVSSSTLENNLGSPKSYASPAVKTSYLGTPVYEVLELVSEDGTIAYTFPDNTMVDADAAKIIEKTRIDNRNGTVKEYIGMDDWKVNIYGILLNYESYDYPEEKVAELVRIFREPKAWKVQGMSLNALGIYNLVTESIQLKGSSDEVGAQAFVIPCCSDEPIELTIEEDSQ